MRAHFKEISYDQFTPITAYYALAGKGCCILESSPGKDRYSFVGIDPIESISGKEGYTEALRKFRKKFPVEANHPLALFTGGPIGYVGYDGDYFFQIYRSCVAFDHQTGRAVLSTIGEEEELKKLFEKLTQPMVLPQLEQVVESLPDGRRLGIVLGEDHPPSGGGQVAGIAVP